MKMLKKAKNKMAYGKVGLYGSAGSGKTFTSALLAIGLHQFAKLKKPVAMFDTEPAASFIIPLFKKAGIEFYVYDESRALKDLMAFMDEAEQECSIVIIDSITHVWKDAQKSFLKKANEKRKAQRKPPIYRLEFQHWGIVKDEWGKFTDRYLSSKLHCILCGRAGSIYEYQANDDTGKKELITSGTKMATEKEMGYEPSLLIEMIQHRQDGRIVNRAIVEKDRADLYNGQIFDSPNFDTFRKHFEFLNIGGDHFDSMDKKDSTDLYEGINDDGFGYEKRQREICSEEIKSLFTKYNLDGTKSEVKKERVGVMEQFFGTTSWTAITSMNSNRMRDCYITLKDHLEGNGFDDDVPQ